MYREGIPDEDEACTIAGSLYMSGNIAYICSVQSIYVQRKKQARAYREIIPDEDEAEVRVALVEQQQRRQARSDGVWVPH